MHYRNGREAKNGDKVVMFDGGQAKAVGQLQNAVAGEDYCNGELVITVDGPTGPAIVTTACICDCLHVNDLAAILADKHLDERPDKG